MTNSNDVMMKQLEMLDRALNNRIENSTISKTDTTDKTNYKIGDIAMVNICSDEWLVCNGQSVDSTLYPEIYSLFNYLPVVSDVSGNFYSIKAR